MYFNELLTYEEIQEKYKQTQHDAICYLLKGGLFQDMSEIIERIESLEERADTTDGTIAQIQIDIEDLKQRMTEVETTVVQIMEKFDDYYTKTETEELIADEIGDAISDEYQKEGVKNAHFKRNIFEHSGRNKNENREK